jgi:GDP-L-fucose synthase
MNKKISKTSKIYVAGHKGMVGSACVRLFKSEGYLNLILRSSNELDLTNQQSVNDFFKKERPEIVINAAAKVGGIWANNEFPYEFLMENMLIQNNLIKASFDNEVDKFIFLGSSCIYPKMANQPIIENSLLTGELEETNQWYAIAKISGVKLIEALRNEYGKDYIALMPTNLYGPGDNYDLNTSHVLPAMIRKFHEAKQNNTDVTIWGTGTPLREFLHVDDLANAVLFCLENEIEDSLYNVGSGQELTILELANLVSKTVGFNGSILLDRTKPDGTPRKLLNSNKIMEKGFKSRIPLEEGIKSTYLNYIS